MPAHSPIPLRIATLDDLPFLLGGFQSISEMERSDTGLQLSPDFSEQAQEYLRSLLDRSDCLILIADNAEQAGFLIGQLLPTPNAFTTVKLYGLIQCLYVQEKFSGQGIGRQLIEAFEQTVVQHGAEYVDVQHVISNERASEFWDKNDYKAVGMLRRKPIGTTNGA